MKNDYWLHQSSKEAIGKLEEVREGWSMWSSSPIRQTWVRNFLSYYSPTLSPTSNDTALIFEGIQGELVRYFTPKARTLIQQQVTLITKQKLSAQCIAEADGSDIVQDVKLGNAILDQVIQMERCDFKGRELCEGGLVCGAWFLETNWRTDKGQPYTRGDNGAIIYTGGVDITPLSIFDVYYDVTISDWTQLPYCETRRPMNRWDLLAQHPELETAIKKLPSVSEVRGPNVWFNGKGRDYSDDLVYVYKCYAKPSPALPNGRLIIYSADDCVYYDDENIYGGIPVEVFMPEKILSVGLGYPTLTNLSATQEMYDNSLSAIATNQSQFAVQSVAVPRGAGISVQELNGMRFVSFTPQNVPGGGKPEPLQLTQSSPESFKYVDLLDKTLADLSMIPGAMRGAPPPGVTSGVAIATLSANAMEFMNGVAMSYALCWEKTFEHVVNCYKKFGKVPQTVRMSGPNSQISFREFRGQQLKCISGVSIQLTNPLMQTIAGRLEISEKLMSMPREMWPQYVSILEGRPLRDIYKGDLSQMDLISQENELLGQGQLVPALASDDHGLHAQQHAGLLNDPAIRMNGQTIQVILDHIEEHKRLAQQTDPFFMAMIRTGRVPEMPPAQPPMPGQGGPGPQVPAGMPTQDVAQPAEDALQRGAL